MKNLFFRGNIILLIGLCLLIKVQLKAQSISIISNIKAISNETITSKDSTNLAFQGETSLSLNLRFFTSGMWAVRLGIGSVSYKHLTLPRRDLV